MRTRKVGTFTLGCILIIMGILFLLHLFTDAITYRFIFQLWPLILVFLGIEVLLSRFQCEKFTFLYDKAAIFLLIVLTFFAMSMAMADWWMNYAIACFSCGNCMIAI